MEYIFLYIGPGLGIATIIIVIIVLLIILASIIMLIWRPLKNFLKRTRKLFNINK